MAEAAKNKDSKEEKKKHHEPRDTLREVIETVVFVVVLVLMLQLFVAQAFVIPTGSMATTLLGHHKTCECAECGYEFTVNASEEVEHGRKVLSYICPNCRYSSDLAVPRIKLPSPSSGDRVIVLKPQYHLADPQRWDVPVFKFPGDSSYASLQSVAAQAHNENVPHDIREWIRNNPDTPIDGPLAADWERRNYIKRLIGKGGETIGITGGDLYMSSVVRYPEDRFPEPEQAKNAWKFKYMYMQSYESLDFLTEGDFRILRKPANVMSEMKRIVYDNDHHAESLIGKIPPRWFPEEAEGWEIDDVEAPHVFTYQGGERSWLRYQHLIPDWFNLNPGHRTEPRPIQDFMGYNHGSEGHWVGDLMVECEVDINSDQAEVVLELAEGMDRFQAIFKMPEGICTLRRIPLTGEAVELATQPISFGSSGSYHLRLANFDDQLTVWVDSSVVEFGDAANYIPAGKPDRYDPEDVREDGWVRENDIERPARIGVTGEVEVNHIKLWRDTYYTTNTGSLAETYYVQPGHYFCLGDNSAQSADSRTWGLVPERLMIGRALLVYFPPSRIGLIK